MATLDKLSEAARQRRLAERAARRAGVGNGATALPAQYRQSGAPSAGGGSFQMPRMTNTGPYGPVDPSYWQGGTNATVGAVNTMNNAMTQNQAMFQQMAFDDLMRREMIKQRNADNKAKRRSNKQGQQAQPKAPNAYEDYMAKVTAKRQNAANQQQEQQDRRAAELEAQRQFDERMRMQQDWQAAADEARQANENRYADILNDFGVARRDAADRYDATTENIDARYTTARDQAGQLTAAAREDADNRYGQRQTEGMDLARENNQGVDAAHAARYSTGMNLLKGAGDQERADIAQQARDASAAVDNNLVSRGLTGSTIAPTLQAGVQRDRYAAEGRLNDRLRGDELGLHTQLSGDRIGSQERGGQALQSAFTNLSGDRNAAADRLSATDIAAQLAMLQNQTGAAISNDANRNQVLTGLDSDRRNFMERRTDAYPDPNLLMTAMSNLSQTAGATTAPVPTVTMNNGTTTSRGIGWGTPAKKPAKKKPTTPTMNMTGWATRLPSFAYGGVMPHTGLAQTGEIGPERVRYPNGQQGVVGANGPQVSVLPAGTQVYANPYARQRPKPYAELEMPKPHGTMPGGFGGYMPPQRGGFRAGPYTPPGLHGANGGGYNERNPMVNNPNALRDQFRRPGQQSTPWRPRF